MSNSRESSQPESMRELSTAIEQAWGCLETGERGALMESWSRAQLSATGLIARAGEEPNEETRDLLAQLLESLEARARALFRETDHEPREEGHRLALIRAEARLVRRVTRAVEGRPSRDETPFILSELQEVENGLREPSLVVDDDDADPPAELPSSDSSADAEAAKLRASELRLHLIRSNAELQVAKAAELTSVDQSNMVRAFRLSRALFATIQDLTKWRSEIDEKDREAIARIVDSLDGERKRLQDLFDAFVDGIEDRSASKTASLAALTLTGELDEARMAAFERATPETVRWLEQLRTDGRRFDSSYSRALQRVESTEAKSEPDETESDDEWKGIRRSQRRLRRMTRRVDNLIADRILSLRLEKIFGARLVRYWETLVFWLIIGVLALIVIDHYREAAIDEEIEILREAGLTEQIAEIEAEERKIGWTIWVDTAVCFLLLCDFLVRMLLSPRRLRYLIRHFLTEFLPSVPFGLIEKLEHVKSFEASWLVVFVKMLRFGRVFRVLRFLRPAIRFLRLMLFVARASDRLVERNSWLLNQNIVFFTDPVKDETVPTLLKRARNLDGWISRTTTRTFPDLPADVRGETARWRLGLVETEMGESEGRHAVTFDPQGRRGTDARDLDVDDVIRTLREVDDNQVAEFLGVDFARQLTSSLRFFRLPFLRSLPFVRFVVGPTGAPDPLWTTARLGRLAGDVLDQIQRAINWFADLYGTITGAQFLDRVGMQLIKATARPAKRLLMFGAIVGMMFAFVLVFRIQFLRPAAVGLWDFLLGPVLILGAVCFIPLAIGHWFRRIAGQAADFYDRVAEAQFLALTEMMKEERQPEHLDFLARRVLLPELRTDAATVDGDADAELIGRVCLGSIDESDPEVVDGLSCPIDWSKRDFMMLFYRDFIDGAFFHRNDTKIANMLLGNLTLENIRLNRLAFSKKRMRKLEQLDIGRGKGGVTGPYVWFNFITHAVAQHTARLIIEYNRHCIPAAELEVADEEDRRVYDSWLEKRRRSSAARREGQPPGAEPEKSIDGQRGTLVYRTTEFNALHFLTRDAKRDASVRETYGPTVSRLLEEDRENLIRDIFGTFPMHEFPKEKRTFNPYEFYRGYFSRGKVFLFPVMGFWLVFRGFRLLFKRLLIIIKDVIRPEARRRRSRAGHAGFEVARRKIHRMRRPVIMETVRLRAEFDIEYLGLALPGRELSIGGGQLLADDLRTLNASEREWEEFRVLKSEREGQIRVLNRVLRYNERQRAGGDENDDASLPAVSENGGQAMRAVATAFICDHEGAASVVTAFEALKSFARRLPQEGSRRRRFRMPAFQKRKIAELVDAVWPLLSVHLDTDEDEPLFKSRLVSTMARRQPGLKEHLVTLNERMPGGGDVHEYAYLKLAEVAAQPSSWTEQVIAIRTVQSLGMLDLLGYERIIALLGRYEDAELDSKAGERDLEQTGPRL